MTRSHSTARDPALRLLRLLTSGAIFLTLVVTTASAYLRLAEDGHVCEQGARCASPATSFDGAPNAAANFVRLVHRVTASADALLVAGVAFLAWRQRRRQPGLRRIAYAALGSLLFLAVLGAIARGSRLPAVTLGNLAGGWTLIALLAWLRVRCVAAPVACAVSQAHARLALAALLLQLILGGVASAEFAGVDCRLGPACRDAWAQTSGVGQLSAWTLQLGSDGRAVASPAARALLLAHRVTGILVGAYLVAFALRMGAAGNRARRRGSLLLLLVILQIGFAFSSVTLGLPLAAGVLHNLGAALLLLVLASLMRRSRAAAPDRES